MDGLLHIGLLATASPEWTPDALFSFASRFHPVVVHFPIALAFAALFAELISFFPKQQWASSAARFCLVLAAFGAIAAGLTGWLKFTHGPMAGVTPDDATNLHRWVGTIAGSVTIAGAVLGIVSSARPDSRAARWLFRSVLLATAALIGFTGHLGGILVFGSDHFSFAG